MKYWERVKEYKVSSQETNVLRREDKESRLEFFWSEQILKIISVHFGILSLLSFSRCPPTHDLWFVTGDVSSPAVCIVFGSLKRKAFRQMYFLVPSIGLDTRAYTKRWNFSKTTKFLSILIKSWSIGSESKNTRFLHKKPMFSDEKTRSQDWSFFEVNRF